jgi:hypothetical protein
VTDPIEPFDLFCAYYLGLDEHGRFRHQNIHDVARRFRAHTSVIEAALKRYRMDSDRMLSLDFDMAGAQLDMQVSPPGVDLPSIARMHYDLFLEAREKPRDWERERIEDERINNETYRNKR